MGSINEFLTYRQVQEYLKVSESTLLRMIADKYNPLKVVYLGESSPRVRLVDLTDWINKQDELVRVEKGFGE